MEIRCNATGAKRKELVRTIADATGARAEYKFMPTCSYEIGGFTVTRDGTLRFDENSDSKDVGQVLEAIAAAGFECEPQEDENSVGKEISEETNVSAENVPQAAPKELTVAVPRDTLSDAAIENLKRIVASKSALLKKALGTDCLSIEVSDEQISFPWFAEADGDSVKAYTHLVTALCEMAGNAKRVTATEKETENEKYAFRCFLLRLGFIGAEYKTERKILLKNLTGSSAFKSGAKKEVDHEFSE